MLSQGPQTEPQQNVLHLTQEVLETALTALVADLVALVVLREVNYVGLKMQTGDVEGAKGVGRPEEGLARRVVDGSRSHNTLCVRVTCKKAHNLSELEG